MWLFIIAILLGHVLQQEFIESWPDPHLRSKGSIWPQPQYITMGKESMTVNSEVFIFVSTVGQCEIIDKAIERYYKRLFDKIQLNEQKMIKREDIKTMNDEV